MGKEVDLVVYENGERKVVGEVIVEDDGSFKAEVTDPEYGKELGFVLGPVSLTFEEEKRGSEEA